MKSIFLVLLVLLVSCQREIRNEVGVGYNKELIIPPTNDLPLPNSADENTTNTEISNNPVIPEQTTGSGEDDDTEEEEGNFFQRLFKGKKK